MGIQNVACDLQILLHLYEKMQYIIDESLRKWRNYESNDILFIYRFIADKKTTNVILVFAYINRFFSGQKNKKKTKKKPKKKKPKTLYKKLKN